MSSRTLQAALIVAALWLATLAQAAPASTNVIAGTLEKVDTGAKTITVKTADGTVETAKFSEHTTVQGLTGAAKGADLAGKEGGNVIVHTADKSAKSVEWLGDKTIHAAEGTVTEGGKASKTVAVKTADGTEHTFQVADHATVHTGKDVAHYSEVGAKKGEHVTVYYTEESGKKVAHVFKSVF
jgi:hypothetical protein